MGSSIDELPAARATGAPRAEPLLVLEDIDKSFGITQALSDADLTVYPGEVVGLVGPNGAGKSTLMKVITGVLEPTDGSITVRGRRVARVSQREIVELGIACAYQDLSLCTNLSVYENFALLNMDHGAWSPRGWRKEQQGQAAALLERYFPGHGIDVTEPVSALSLAGRQMVEICKALMDDHLGLLVLDEPTSALSANRAEQLHAAVREVSAAGVAVIYISHKLDEIQKVCDRIVLLKNGTDVGEFDPGRITPDDLVGLMGGGARALADASSRGEPADGPVLVSASGYGVPGLTDIDLEVRAGEIVGIAGLVGSGQPTLLKSIFARRRGRVGTLRVGGQVSYVSGDRAGEGVFPLWSILDNIVVSSLRGVTRLGLVDRKRSATLAGSWFDRLRFRAESVNSPITSLSGGNQQKALIARGLASGADVILLNDPTAGVDIETKQEIYGLLSEARAAGKAVVFHSTEDAEMEICDRVYVMREGRVTSELSGADVSVDSVVRASFAEVERTATEGRRRSAMSRLLQSRLVLPISAMLVIFALNAAVNPNVLTLSSARLLLGTAVPLVFAALGQMFVVTAGDIDMGNGYSIGLANVLVAFVLSGSLVVGLVSLVLLVAAYALMGALIHLRQLPAIVVTLGAQFVWLGVALIVSPVPGGQSPQWLSTLYRTQVLVLPMPAVLCLVAAAGGWFVVFRWKYGMVLRGVGNNRDAIERSGWSFLLGKMTNYALAGLMVVLAGMSFTAVTYAADVNTSLAFCMMSIATVIVGGCEMSGGVVEPIGVVAAAVAMSLITSLLVFIKVDSNLQMAVTGLIIISVLATRLITRRRASVAA
ncbi:MAG: ATP-binding cassette domain-containing protein [Actinomycetales bacterium]|nr:ATP-binding cassette domain-containing protein [Actinomycetales bacterium]